LKEEFIVLRHKTLQNFLILLKKIYFELDKEKYPDDWFVVWDKNKYQGDLDGFEVKRKGNIESEVKIYIEIDYNPSKYKLSSELAKFMGLDESSIFSKPTITVSLWQYIQKKKFKK